MVTFLLSLGILGVICSGQPRFTGRGQADLRGRSGQRCYRDARRYRRSVGCLSGRAGLVAGPGVDVAAAELGQGVLHGGGQGGSNSSLVCPIVGGDGAAGGETGEHLAVGVATRLDGGGFGSRPGWVVPRSAPRAVAGVGNCAIDIGGICWCGSQGARVTVVAAAVATPATATANRRRRVIIVVIGESFPNAGGAAVSTSN